MSIELHLERQDCGRNFTIGRLSIDGKFECFTLEDQMREPGVKVPGQTCIPAGRYALTITFSNRFHRRMPLIAGVPMFEGIRIHPGNTAEDTEGCILVGTARNGSTIQRSKAAYDELYGKLAAADANGVPMWITIDGGEVPV